MNHARKAQPAAALFAFACAIVALPVQAGAQTTAPVPEGPPAPADASSTPSQSDIVVTASNRIVAGTDRPVAAGEYLLGKAAWSDVLAGTSALALIKNLPGVTFTSTDAYGLDLSDGFLLVRGFRQNELAVTFEGVPLNDGSYGSVTGTAPLNIGVTANIGSVSVSPGSAGLGTFSNSVDGGEVRYMLADPKAKPSLDLMQGIGSNDTFITSATANTGTLGSGGPRVLLGVERISKDKYTGAGSQYMLRANAKLVQDLPWGDVTAFVSYSRAKIWGYNNTSFDMLNKLGWNGTDILYPDYAHATYVNQPGNAAKSCGAYSCGTLATLRPYDTGQATRDVVASLAHHFHIGEQLSGSVQAYGAVSSSDIEISDVSTPSQTGAPFSSLVWQTRPRRFGGTASLSYQTGDHILTTGLWVERTHASSVFASYNQPLLGQGAPLRAIGPYDVYGPAFRFTNASHWQTHSFQMFVQDVFKPSDALTLTAGFKAVDFTTSGGGIGPDQAPNGRLRARNAFLPQLRVDWRPDERSSLYFDVAETEIGYRVSSRGNIGPISSAWAADSQALFDAALPTLRPERDWNFTLGGYRSFGAVRINLDVYYGIILNRLLNGTSGLQYEPVRSVGIVPRSTLWGADAIVSATIVPGLEISQSAAVSKLRYASDLNVAGTVVPLKGNYQPGYPGVSLVTQLTARHGRAEAGFTSTVYLDQPFNYANDIMVPNYWQANAHVSYALPSLGFAKRTTLRLDANNLFNRRNIGSVGIGGYSVTGDFQTFMRSAPRQILLSLSTSL
ncbi:TonB-dependent receptor [Sphingomonadaceae bacterium jetA1]|jgi:hypothetical protein|uniref:TonB-dependent receptor n=1 Tax=Facivitalis istanbulensis TaxID=3075838 RepID=UPI0034820A8F